ncbi:hypothetical protein [Streptomyces sp. NPDC055013]
MVTRETLGFEVVAHRLDEVALAGMEPKPCQGASRTRSLRRPEVRPKAPYGSG